MILKFLVFIVIQFSINPRGLQNEYAFVDAIMPTGFKNSSSGCDESGLSMSLRDVGLKRIDSDFASSPNVSCLDLEANEIAYVAPDAFRSMINLAYLNLARNKLSLGNFSVLNGHRNLQTLVLDDNNDQATEILEFNNTFPRLYHFYLRNTSIQDIASLKFAPRIKHLYLSSNNLADSDLSFLNNSYTLELLDLANCSIGHANISTLHWLQELRLDDNLIKRLCTKCQDDSALVLEGLSALRQLTIARNDINSVEPDAFDDTERLQELDLSHNKIDSIRKETLSGAVSLLNLTLNNNLLTSMPDLCGPESLEHLNLSYNRIELVMNDSFCLIRTLRTIDLSSNAIRSIEVGAFAAQTRLEFLDLSNNRLTTFPRFWLQRLINLKVLLVNGNVLKSLYDLQLSTITVNAKLERVDLRNNSIQIFNTRTLFHSLRSEQNAPNITLELFDENSINRECIPCRCDSENEIDL